MGRPSGFKCGHRLSTLSLPLSDQLARRDDRLEGAHSESSRGRSTAAPLGRAPPRALVRPRRPRSRRLARRPRRLVRRQSRTRSRSSRSNRKGMAPVWVSAPPLACTPPEPHLTLVVDHPLDRHHRPPYAHVKLDPLKYNVPGPAYDVSLEATLPVNENNIRLGQSSLSPARRLLVSRTLARNTVR